MLKTREEIKSWLDNYGIANYTINDDLTVDVDRDVYLNNCCLIEIPVQFNVVNGQFWCAHNNLTSLIGSPKIVGNFWCSSNQLTSLKGSPKVVKGWFDCTNNQLTSLKHLPEIHENIACDKHLKETREYKVYSISNKLKEMV